MDAMFTDEQRQFRAAVRDFCAKETRPREKRDKVTDNGRTQHSDAIYRQMAELGWVGSSIPEEYGGGGAGAVEECIFLEESQRGRAPIVGGGVSLIVAGVIKRFGSEEQKHRVLGSILKGDVHAIAMSEPDAGSDVGAMKCRAERRNGGYVVNGHKTWITGAQDAVQILLVARENPDGRKHEGMTMLEIPTDAGGLEIRGIPTMMSPDEVNDVFFTDVAVDASAVVGEPEQAWMQLMSGLSFERVVAAAGCLGTAWTAFDEALAYVKEREQFGRPIGKFQSIKHRLARHATELTATQAMIYTLARQIDADPTAMIARESSMAKLKASELCKEVALDAQHMMGGYGYTLEYDIEAIVRQALIMPVPAGCSEVQLDIIAMTYGL